MGNMGKFSEFGAKGDLKRMIMKAIQEAIDKYDNIYSPRAGIALPETLKMKPDTSKLIGRILLALSSG